MRRTFPVLAALAVTLALAPRSLRAQQGTMQAAKPRAPAKPRVHGPCQTPKAQTPTANGRYTGLVRKVHVPGDCAYYGSFHDWGWWSFSRYAGQANLPAAYWVYHYPYWHLYRAKKGANRPMTPAPAPRCQPPKKTNPSVNGRYWSLLRKLHVPGDCGLYGSFNEYGQYPTTSYAGQANLPAAYWVYHYPHWYLWQHRRP